jgi:hypothetical protein
MSRDNMRIDATTNTTEDIRPEWQGPAFMGGRVFVTELGCLDAPDIMPSGSVRRMYHDPDAQIPDFWHRIRA